MEAYAEAKARLFREHLTPGGVGVVNLDDPLAERFLAATREGGARTIGVTREPEIAADVRVESAEVVARGHRARGSPCPPGRSTSRCRCVGDFNVENLLVAVGIAVGPRRRARRDRARRRELPAGAGPHGARRQRPARRRRSCSSTTRTRPTPSRRCCARVRPLTAGRLIAVFGCGGDRDRSKRPRMAEAVARIADRAVLTSDNPRTEDPRAILAEVEQGLAGLTRVEPVAPRRRRARATRRSIDRRAAIELAIASARPGDTVVIAGKGHEDYQIIGREKLPFDDRDEARRALAEARLVIPIRAGDVVRVDRRTAACAARRETRLRAASRPTRARVARRPAVRRARSARTHDAHAFLAQALARRRGRPAGRRGPSAVPAGADGRGGRGGRHHARARRARRGPSRRLRGPGRRDHRQQRQDHDEGDVRGDPRRPRPLPQEPRAT